MSKKIEFRGQISPIMSAIRMGGDVMRISFDVPLTERENAIGLLALTDQPLKFEISVDGTSATQKPRKEKGEHSAYWQELFRRGFQNYPDLIECLNCAGDQIRLRLHDVFKVDSLTHVSPEQLEDWLNSEGLHSLITLSRQVRAKLQEAA